jgi:hypothetical protein
VQAPTAATVMIGGHVIEGRRGMLGATVHLTDQNGNVRETRTNPFGYYRFDDVEVGQTYIITAYHKLFQFHPQVITVNEQMDNLTITAQNNWNLSRW